MKIKDIVKGLEEKDTKGTKGLSPFNKLLRRGYNSCANTEVIISQKTIRKALCPHDRYISNNKCKTLCLLNDKCNKSVMQITAALRSGKIVMKGRG